MMPCGSKITVVKDKTVYYRELGALFLTISEWAPFLSKNRGFQPKTVQYFIIRRTSVPAQTF